MLAADLFDMADALVLQLCARQAPVCCGDIYRSGAGGFCRMGHVTKAADSAFA
jgi:hypothetical protein